MSAPLKRFVIERDMPGVGKRTPEELAGAAKARRRLGGSCNALKSVGSDRVQWVHSHVTGDRTYCIYLATSEEAIREHTAVAGIPATKIEEVTSMLDPTHAAGAP